VEIGCFYFLTDQFYQDFPNDSLPGNKPKDKSLHDRPCFYAFFDKKTNLYWVIPISHQVEKYKAIYQHKTSNGKKCDTIVLGKVLGQEKAFLIQNMCPVTNDYIKNQYLCNNKPVKLPKPLEKELCAKAKKVLALYRKGYTDLLFADVVKMEQTLTQHIEFESEVLIHE
jgi:hypothetical protein